MIRITACLILLLVLTHRIGASLNSSWDGLVSLDLRAGRRLDDRSTLCSSLEGIVTFDSWPPLLDWKSRCSEGEPLTNAFQGLDVESGIVRGIDLTGEGLSSK